MRRKTLLKESPKITMGVLIAVKKAETFKYIRDLIILVALEYKPLCTKKFIIPIYKIEEIKYMNSNNNEITNP